MILLPPFYYPESNEVDSSDDSENADVLPQTDAKAREERAEKRNERKISDARLEELESLEKHSQKEEKRMTSLAKQYEYNPTEQKTLLCFMVDLFQQAQRIRMTREFLKDVNWELKVIVLPDICVTLYSSRFDFNEARTLKLVNRLRGCEKEKYVNTIYNNVITKNKTPCLQRYFYGCAGVGKSFFLYQLSCRLMQKEDMAVIYVPQCDAKIIRKTLKTLYLVCKSFDLCSLNRVLDDKNRNLKDIILNIEASGNDFHFVTDVIVAIEQALFAENKHLVFIIDQVNVIMGDQNVYNNQIEFLNHLLRNYNVLVSGSANNEVSRMKITSEYIEDVHLIFDPDDFLSFLAVRSIVDKIRDNHRENKQGSRILDTETINAILDLTGAIPLEVKRFIDVIDMNHLTSFSVWSQKYETAFQREYTIPRMSEWYKNKDKQEKESVLKNALICLMREKANLADDYYDKRLIVMRKSNGSYFLEPITPLFREIVYSIYAHDLKESLIKNFRNVTSSIIGQHPSILGVLLEKHLIVLIRLKALEKFEVFSINDDGNAHSTTLKFENFKCVEFSGYYAPKQQFQNGNTLFIPTSTQYPGFDFIYYCKYSDSVFFINITKQQDAFKHILDNDDKAKKGKTIKKTIRSWSKFLPNVAFYDIYFILKSNFEIKLDRTGWRSCNVVYIEDLKKENPAVAYSKNVSQEKRKGEELDYTQLVQTNQEVENVEESNVISQATIPDPAT